MLPFNFNLTVALERATLGQDAGGGTTRTWAQVGTLSALIEPARASVRFDYSRRDMVVDYEIYTTSALSIQENDRINESGTHYVVHGMLPFRSMLIDSDRIVCLHCERRTPEN